MRSLALIVAFLLVAFTGWCQESGFEKKIQKLDSLNTRYQREKIFIHCDRPQYKPDDTIWLKGYVLSATDHLTTDSSGIVYIEFLDGNNELVKRTAAPIFAGRFSSSIKIDKALFKQGTYLLRAYTQWMRNFGDSLFYESRFTVIESNAQNWKADIRKIDLTNNRLQLSALFKIGEPVAPSNSRVEIKLRSGNRTVFNMRTTIDSLGNLYIDTVIKNNISDKKLLLDVEGKNNISLQLPIQKTANIDLQFLPEGGTLLAGKTQTLGFKAINIYGKGVAINGVIKNENGTTVTSFSSLRNGMGKIDFKPLSGEIYTAVLNDGTSFELPKAQSSGTILKVLNTPQSDSLTLMMDASSNLYNRIYYFTANSRSATYALGRLNLINPISVNLAKSMFPSGIVRFTLYNDLSEPINERVVFIKHDDDLKLAIKPHKNQYLKKDSVSLQIKVTDNNKAITKGSFSIAVLDTAQVKTLSNSENIASYMLLSSDLKGVIEEPAYYLQHPYSDATDALMLTQGWVNYDWKLPEQKFGYEKEMLITGKAVNAFGKPWPNLNVKIFGKVGRGGAFIMDTVTNNNGEFVFNHFPLFFTDSVKTVIKALNKKDKAFNIGIEVQEPTYPIYSGESLLSSSENIVFDTLAKKFADGQTLMREMIKRDKQMLEEVVITAKAKIPGSKNLNKDGGSDQVIDERTLQKTPKATLLQILKREIKGFVLSPESPRSSAMVYKLNNDLVRFIIDGVDLDFFIKDNSNSEPAVGSSARDISDSYLDNITSEDIRGIEVMTSARYSRLYKLKYIDMVKLIESNKEGIFYSFIEITTYNGSGPFFKNIPGLYLYRPLVPVVTKRFYNPRYQTPDEQTFLPDMRATVYWNPEVTVNEKGEATVSFYTSESSSSYLIFMQGTDLNGKFGVQQQYLNVEQKSPK